MKRSYRKSILAIAFLLLFAFVLNLVGCMALPSETSGTNVEDETNAKNEDETDEQVKFSSVNLLDAISPNKVTKLDSLEDGNAAVTSFALDLFRSAEDDGKNMLFSPLSVLYALAMVANGAKGETLEQIENAVGMSIDELNLYLHSYINRLPQGEKYKLALANSVWLNDDERLTVNNDFLQDVADYYDADIYKVPFDDVALKDINYWVKDKTDGMIPQALDRIPGDAVAYLINALVFDAEWETMYDEYSVREARFTLEDGSEKDVELMYGTERRYLEDDMATGFIKNYIGYKYAFVALLPKEGITVSEYVESLDGEALRSLLFGAREIEVRTAMPKFETEYNTELSEVLKSMGIVDAFDSSLADLSGLGSSSSGNIYISRAIHKTYIEVGEKGTRAGAVTVFEEFDESIPQEEPKKVYLDRPFVYMLIDIENKIPFFIGTMMGE